jgi:dTDP-4-amino-4,6-dideoxygalactose transaminase
MARARRRAGELPLSAPDIGADEVEEVLATLRSGWLTAGPRVQELQAGLERYLGVPHVRCLSSCTAGLQLGLRIAGVGPGDEVLVPTMTFVACANVVEQAGARPVLVDCEPESGLVDLDHADSLVTTRTAALMPVHLGGHPVDLDAVNAFRDRNGVAVVEDAAHAIGARWRGRAVGAHGNPTAYSFHASKNMTTFEGGALAVHDEATAERVARLAVQGLSRSSWARHGSPEPAAYEVVEPGFKSGMHDVAAAVGIHQLRRLDGWIERRRAIAEAYDERLSALPLELPPPVPHHARHAHHLYAVRVRPDAPAGRDEVVAALHEARIGSSVHYRPIHTFTYYATRCGLRPEDLPAAWDRSRRAVSLPLHHRMTEEDVEDVAAVIAGVLG